MQRFCQKSRGATPWFGKRGRTCLRRCVNSALISDKVPSQLWLGEIPANSPYFDPVVWDSAKGGISGASTGFEVRLQSRSKLTLSSPCDFEVPRALRRVESGASASSASQIQARV